MSWYNGMKEVQFRGVQTIKVTLSKELLQDVGADYPFYIDFVELLKSAFGDSIEDVVGKGNMQVLDYMYWDFMFESFVWPNWFTEHEEALFDSKSDLNFLIHVSVLSVNIENDYTSRRSTRDNVIFMFTHPDFQDEDKKLQLYLGGFFSPAQEMIMSNFNEIGKSSLFHECIHAFKRSGDDLLRDVMYGNSEAEVTEEIMTHFVTDKFGSLTKLNDLITKGLEITYDSTNGYLNPLSLTTKSSKNSILPVQGKALHARMDKRGITLNSKRIALSHKLEDGKKLKKLLLDRVKGKKDSSKDLARTTVAEAGFLSKSSSLMKSSYDDIHISKRDKLTKR